MDSQGKSVAAVTGGSTGIGRATVEAFLTRGIQTYTLGIERTMKDTEMDRFIQCDVSRQMDVEAAFQIIESDTGHLNYLINNAGVLSYGSVLDTEESEWDRVMNINLKGAFLCAKSAIPLMKQNAVIVNVASVQAFVAQPIVAAYCTSKTALLGLTRSIAIDFGPRIRCVAVCPGTIDTPMLHSALEEASDPNAMMEELVAGHLTGRVGKPEEIGALISFLCSEKCSFITGQAIRVDGGLGINIGGSKN